MNCLQYLTNSKKTGLKLKCDFYLLDNATGNDRNPKRQISRNILLNFIYLFFKNYSSLVLDTRARHDRVQLLNT